uniref:MAE-28990/MAE-18760-like HEPN domain-containing protein n=1 Tax=Cyanothece sp. (strain PCC 7425 / ATCC 29141) TaxID=395961 RepID=B8HJL4_CYAP4
MNQYETSWTELNFIETELTQIYSLDTLSAHEIKWFVFECSAENQWICDVNQVVMDFGGVFHSIFLRWAVTVNGLYVAAEKYQSGEWLEGGHTFSVSGIRKSHDGTPEFVPVRVWDGQIAASIHESSVPMLAGWAFCNMYSCLEEFIFKIFRLYLEAHPLEICDGREFGELRRAYRERERSEEKRNEWHTLWAERLESWHRKKVYKGIEKVFIHFCEKTGIKIPSGYKNKDKFDYSDIARTLGGIALIRNCFIHGVTTVPQELEDFCSDFRGLFFRFNAGEKFQITIQDLATLEYFTDTFTTTLNLSLFELIYPGMTDPKNLNLPE